MNYVIIRRDPMQDLTNFKTKSVAVEYNDIRFTTQSVSKDSCLNKFTTNFANADLVLIHFEGVGGSNHSHSPNYIHSHPQGSCDSMILSSRKFLYTGLFDISDYIVYIPVIFILQLLTNLRMQLSYDFFQKGFEFSYLYDLSEC